MNICCHLSQTKTLKCQTIVRLTQLFQHKLKEFRTGHRKRIQISVQSNASVFFFRLIHSCGLQFNRETCHFTGLKFCFVFSVISCAALLSSLSPMPTFMKKSKNVQYTYQLEHVFIFWHNGKLQHTLAARQSQAKEEEGRYKT